MNETPATGNTLTGPRPDPIGASTERHLRRSRTNRVGAGVAAGLGEYFGVDPVLFRVLFATSAFFGGAGVLAYLLAWALIPDEGTEHAPIDGWVSGLRRRRTPLWVVVAISVLVLWALTFTWWSPAPLLPVVVVVVVLAVVFGRRDWQRRSSAADPSSDTPTVDLSKAAGTPPATRSTAPGWVGEGVAWLEQARADRRARRHRALPVKLATVGTLAVALIALGIADSTAGIMFQVYFWAGLAIVGAGLLVGMLLRRTPWSLATLLPVLVAGVVAFAGSPTQLGDGIGQKQWRPTDVPSAHYAVAFGQGVLDLSRLPLQSTARTVDVRVGAGQLRIIAPPQLNLTVNAHVHIGEVRVDRGGTPGRPHGGVEFNRTIDAPPNAAGAPITVDVHLTDGQVLVQTG